jgi:hypothetical protein
MLAAPLGLLAESAIVLLELEVELRSYSMLYSKLLAKGKRKKDGVCKENEQAKVQHC